MHRWTNPRVFLIERAGPVVSIAAHRLRRRCDVVDVEQRSSESRACPDCGGDLIPDAPHDDPIEQLTDQEAERDEYPRVLSEAPADWVVLVEPFIAADGELLAGLRSRGIEYAVVDSRAPSDPALYVPPTHRQRAGKFLDDFYAS